MVVGIDKFREHFAGHEDQYAIIGGTACDLLFDQEGLEFRATKDIDMVLCVEVVDAAFGQALKTFLDSGGYEARERSDGWKEFYRFHRPKDEAYPFMIELFARNPGVLNLPEGAWLTPVPVDEDVLSLSAILLDNGYYEAIQSAKQNLDGVTIIDQTLLIPFKARAFLDFDERIKKGERVDSNSIKKHRNDVFRLVQLLSRDANIKMPESIQDDMRRFVELVKEDKTLNPKDFDVSLTLDEAIKLLCSAYCLT